MAYSLFEGVNNSRNHRILSPNPPQTALPANALSICTEKQDLPQIYLTYLTWPLAILRFIFIVFILIVGYMFSWLRSSHISDVLTVWRRKNLLHFRQNLARKTNSHFSMSVRKWAFSRRYGWASCFRSFHLNQLYISWFEDTVFLFFLLARQGHAVKCSFFLWLWTPSLSLRPAMPAYYFMPKRICLLTELWMAWILHKPAFITGKRE